MKLKQVQEKQRSKKAHAPLPETVIGERADLEFSEMKKKTRSLITGGRFGPRWFPQSGNKGGLGRAGLRSPAEAKKAKKG